jgi:hypothetical protein
VLWQFLSQLFGVDIVEDFVTDQQALLPIDLHDDGLRGLGLPEPELPELGLQLRVDGTHGHTAGHGFPIY